LEKKRKYYPAPAQMTVGEGTFTIHPGIEIGYADESLKGMGELLSNEIEKLSGIKLASASDKNRIASSPRVDRSERVRRPAKSLWIESER